MSKTAGVYEIVCRATGVRYVGESVEVETRLKRHLRELRAGSHGNPYLQAAFARYGESQFATGILWEVPAESLMALPKERVSELTKRFEANVVFGMLDHGLDLFNFRPVSTWEHGDGIPTPETRAAQSLKLKALRQADEYRDAVSRRQKEVWRSKELRDALSRKALDRWSRPGFREKSSAAFSAGWRSESARASRSGGRHYLARRVVCVDTGQVFDTVLAAAKFAGVTKSSQINRAIERNGKCGGYTWRFVD